MRRIRKDVIEGNIKQLIAEKEAIIVVKDNAYGFGLELLMDCCKKCGVNFFAVKNMSEAKIIRSLSSNAQILLLGKVKSIDRYDLITYHIYPTINDYDDYLLFKKYHIPAHLAIDIGMNRFGMKNGYLAIINDSIVKAIYAHLYEEGLEDKIVFLEELASKYQKPLHLGGSLAYGKTKATLRVGRMIYEHALYFYGTIVNIKKVHPDETVGYDGSFEVIEPTLIGVCDIGYSNGLNLLYHGRVCINGKFYQCMGRCCMDQCFIKIDEKVKIGDEVEFFGKTILEEEFAKENNMTLHETYLAINTQNNLE